MDWLTEALRWLLIVLGWVLAAGTLASISTGSHWLIRGCDFPRLHIGLLAAAIGCLYALVFRLGTVLDAGFVALCLATAGWQAWRIFPYTVLAAREVADAGPRGAGITLMTSNVLMENEQHARWLARVHEADPDLVLALEVDTRWHQAIAVLERSHPYTLHQVQENYYGMALYSRLPLIDPELRFLVQDDIPSIRTGVELPGGRLVRLYGLHPRPPEPLRAQDSGPRDAELVLVGREIAGRDEPAIVLGDFNDVAWSRTNRLFQRLSHLLDPRRGRGFFSTFPAEHPWVRFPLDHIFHSDHFKLIALRCLEPVGSDHLPVFAALRLAPGAAADQDEPAPDAGDQAEAQEKLERVAADSALRQGPGSAVQQQAKTPPGAAEAKPT